MGDRDNEEAEGHSRESEVEDEDEEGAEGTLFNLERALDLTVGVSLTLSPRAAVEVRDSALTISFYCRSS